MWARRVVWCDKSVFPYAYSTILIPLAIKDTVDVTGPHYHFDTCKVVKNGVSLQ